MQNCDSDEKTPDCRNVFRQFSVCVVILEKVIKPECAVNYSRLKSRVLARIA